MKFEPVSKEFRKNISIELEGEDNFTIIEADEVFCGTSSILQLKINRDSLDFPLSMWISFYPDNSKSHFFIEQFFLCVGMKYPENGEFEPSDLIGKSGRAVFGYKNHFKNTNFNKNEFTTNNYNDSSQKIKSKRFIEFKSFIIPENNSK